MNLDARVEATLPSITYGFFLLTTAVFVGPVIVLGVPDGLRQSAQAVLDSLSVGLILFQLVALGISYVLLSKQSVSGPERLRTPILLIVLVLAVANALRMELGANWPGLPAELTLTLWFAAPLALWALALWPVLRRYSHVWWAKPLKWIVVAFPLIFLSAALARIDFSVYIETQQPPTSIKWFLTYGPTLVAVGLGLTGWLWFEERRPSQAVTRDVMWITLTTLAVALFVSSIPGIGFAFSALVTWGSGYQMFSVPSALPPLVLPITLVTATFVALIVTTIGLRGGRGSTIVPLLAFAAVLSGVFPSAISVLGSLAALELLWLMVLKSTGG